MASTITAATPTLDDSKPHPAGPGGAWHRRAPRSLCRAYQAGDAQGWLAWSGHLAERSFRPLEKIVRSRKSPLLWALEADDRLGSTTSLIKLLGAPTYSRGKLAAIKRGASEFLVCLGEPGAAHGAANGSTRSPDALAISLECLAWCAAMPRLTAALGERLWWDLTRRMLAIADEGSAVVEAWGGEPLPLAGHALAQQMLDGELPLALAYSFPELAICEDLAARGRHALTRGLDESLDSQGVPHCRCLEFLRPWWASWTRAATIDRELDAKAWHKSLGPRYAKLFQHVLQLSGAGGQPLFASSGARRVEPELLAAARRLTAHDRETERIVRLVTRGTSPRARSSQLPSPAFESEWGSIAVLRSDWTRSSPRLAVTYGSAQVVTELQVGGRTLWSGTWEIAVQWNGRPLSGSGVWEQVCWESDEDVDYLEIQSHLSDEVMVERHVLLARKDRFLFLADAVVAIQEGAIDYRARLPLAGHSRYVPAEETREGTLVAGGRARARVLPLALGEWRCKPARGALDESNGGLELKHSAAAQALLAPLFIDLNPARLNQETTWRQLTVGQQRGVVPRDVAVGYRVQTGKSQWLVYRSLGPTAIRTVLGTNLMHEFLVARFQADAPIQKLLEIE
jgi:hypothetical protein